MLAASGELDALSTPRLAELLWSRLLTDASAIAVDLRELTFLGVAGLELLACAHAYAHQRGIALSVINTSRAVERALKAGGADTALPCFTGVAAARTASDMSDVEESNASRVMQVA
ncbi:hypothetical protein GCM10027563_28570 [Parasphingorhabdus pacifica]